MRQLPAEVLGLHVDERNLVEGVKLLGRDHLVDQVERLDHPQVLGARHPGQAADDGRLPRAPQQRAQRQARGQRVRVGVVVRQDQHPVGVAEVVLVLLHLLARHRARQLVHQRRPHQLGQGQGVDVGEVGAQRIGPLDVAGAGAQHIDQGAPRSDDRLEHLAQALAPRVLDQHHGARRQVGLHIAVDALGVGNPHRQGQVVQAAGQRRRLDHQLELGLRGKHGLEQAPDQFGMTDRKAAHGP